MKSLVLPAVLMLLANSAAADVPDTQEDLQQILNGRSAELDQRFALKLDKLIETRVLDPAAASDGQPREVIFEDLFVGYQPRYLAWHSAR